MCQKKSLCCFRTQGFPSALLLQTLALTPAAQSGTCLSAGNSIDPLAKHPLMDEPEHSTEHLQPAFLEQQLGMYIRWLLTSCPATGALGWERLLL